MQADFLSTKAAPTDVSYIKETSANVRLRRAEEVLGLRVVKGKVWTTTVTITPAKAKLLLLNMKAQRILRPAEVKVWRNRILNGGFNLTHQGIAVDKEGRVIDGQHRLHGCVEADTPIKVQATFNLDSDLFDSIDRGRSRNDGDDLICASLAQTTREANMLAAASKILWNLDEGRVPWLIPDRGAFPVGTMREVISRHPFIYEAVSFCTKVDYKLRGIGPAPSAAFYTRFHEVNPDKANTFMSQIIGGEYVGHGHPAYHFREYKRGEAKSKSKINRSAQMIILVRAWNAFIEGRRVTYLHAGMVGDVNFPVISKG